MNSNKILTKNPNAKKVMIHLVRGKSTAGIPTYTYLAIYAHRVRDLKLSLITQATDLDKYGVILKSGIGEPDEATKRYIKESYLSGNIVQEGEKNP